MNRLRWGILGTARINRRLIPAIRAASRCELVAIASRNLANADAFAREWSIPRTFDGYQTLLDDDGIDAVYVPLPNSEHVSWTLAAVAAGKHVLCEKPIALAADEVDRIAAAAAARGVIVEEGFMYPHEPLTHRVEALVAAGAVGAIRTISSGFTFALDRHPNVRLDPALGGGSLWDVGCYPVTYAQRLIARDAVSAVGRAVWTGTGIDEEFTGIVEFAGGATASIYSGFRAPYRTWLEVIGTEGSLRVCNPFRPEATDTIELARVSGCERIEVPGSVLLFQREVEDFVAAALDGRTQRITLAESRRTVATLSALYRSARDARACAIL